MNSPLLDFDGSTILVTGAASGFGALFSTTVFHYGANLVLGDVDAPRLESFVKELDPSGERTLCLPCDVSCEQDCQELVEKAVNRFGSLDIAVNNAGIAQPMTALHEQTEAVFDQQFAVNAKGVFFGMKHQIIQMLQQESGIILNISSAAGLGAAPKLAAYGAAKHAVVGLTKTAAVEYARNNIRVNAICPFFSPTPLMTQSAGMDSQDAQLFLAKGSPMKRLADPQEVVNAMVLACSPANSYMTGQTIAIDGGVSAF